MRRPVLQAFLPALALLLLLAVPLEFNSLNSLIENNSNAAPLLETGNESAVFTNDTTTELADGIEEVLNGTAISLSNEPSQNTSAFPDQANLTDENPAIDEPDFTLTQHQATVGVPVQWTKTIDSESPAFVASIPQEAELLEIKELPKTETGNGSAEANGESPGQSQNPSQESANPLQEPASPPQEPAGIPLIPTSLESNEDTTLLTIESNGTVEITYQTPAPVAEETPLTDSSKEITISSEVPCENITATTILPQETSLPTSISLTNSETGESAPFKPIDSDSNGMIDAIVWNASSSGEPYVLSINILTLHSNPELGGNWQVDFTTAGTANLTITASIDPSYSSETTRWSPDSEDGSLYDLRFLEIKCGDTPLAYEWQGENCNENECSVSIPDFACNQTATETSKVLTAKKHTLRFSFGGQEAFAYNEVLTNVSACQEITASNSQYTLNQSVSINDATCFKITGANVTLDCNGKSITGNNKPNTYGIYLTNRVNTTIKNCNISNFQHAIYFLGSTSSLIQNTNASTTQSGGYGIFLNNTNTTTITGSLGNSSIGNGIYMISGSSYNFINSSAGISGSSYGIYLWSGATYNNITNSNATTTSGSALLINAASNYNRITGAVVSGPTATSSYASLYIAVSSNNTVTNTSITSTSKFGFHIYGGENNTLANSNVTATTHDAFILQTGTNNTLIANSTFISNATGTSHVGSITDFSLRNTFSNNTFISQDGNDNLLTVDSTSGNNTFYWNNFTATSSTYVADTNGSNFYNTTIGSQPAGNIWANVISGSVNVSGIIPSPWSGLYYGSNGSGYPYNNSTSNKITGNVVDKAPLTSQQGGVTCSALSSAGTTYAMTANASINGSSCFIIGAANVTLDCKGFSITGNNSTTANGIYSAYFNTTIKNCRISNFQNAIYFYGATNGTITNTTASTTHSSGYGIYLYSGANYNALSNFTATSPDFRALDIESSSNNILSNFTATSTSEVSLNLHANSNNNVLSNFTATTSINHAIIVAVSSNNTLTNFTAASNQFDALSVSTVSNSTFSNFIATSNAGYTLALAGDFNNNTLSNFIATSNTSRALWLASNSYYNTLSNFTVASNASYALFLDSGVYNSTISNFTATSNASYALYIYYSNGNALSNFSATSNTERALYLAQSSSNTLSNFTAISNTSNALYFQSSANNIISKGKLISGNGANNLLNLTGSSGGNTFYWNNFTSTSGYYVNDTNGSNFYNTTIAGKGEGNIWYNVMNNSISIVGTNSSAYGSGWYIGSSGSGYPYNSSTSGGKLSGSVADYAPLITSNMQCDNLVSSYTMTASTIIAGRTCYNITAANVTLDCNGFSITGSNASNTYGIYSNQNNTTIKNCQISNFETAIYFNRAARGTITNITASSTRSAGYGIYFYGANYNALSNFTASSSDGDAFRLDSNSSSNALSNFTVTSGQGGRGLMLYSSSNNTLSNFNTTTSSNTYPAIFIYSSSNNNTIFNFTVTSISTQAVYLSSSSNNTLSNFTATAGASHALRLSSSTGNTLFNFNATGNTAIYLYSGSNNNVLSNFTATAINLPVGLDSYSNNNIFSNFTATTSGYSSFQIESGANNVVMNSNITSTAYTYVIKLGSSATNNTFLQNNIRGNFWVQDPYLGSGNTFNNSTAGNAYYLVNGSGAWTVYSLIDTNGDHWADTGENWPLNETTANIKWSGYSADWHPYTLTAGPPFNIYRVNITPSPPSVLKNMSCTLKLYNAVASASNVSYRWYRNGSIYSTGNLTGLQSNVETTISTIPFTNLTQGEIWQCGVNVQYNATNSSGWTNSSNATVGGCASLTDANTTYYLTHNVTETLGGTCISADAEGITLDCQGNSIIGIGGYAGFHTAASHVTVRNCRIENFAQAVFFEGTSEYNIEYGSVSNVNASGSAGYPVYFGNVRHSNITNVNSNNSNYGIMLEGGSDNSITNTTCNSTDVALYIITAATGNRISGSSFTSTGSPGVVFESTANNNISDSSFTSTYTESARFGGSTGNMVTRSTFYSNVDAGILIKSYSSGNSFSNSDITGSNTAISLDTTDYNNFTGNNLYGLEPGKPVVYLYLANNNIFAGNTVATVSGSPSTAFAIETSNSNSIYHNHIDAADDGQWHGIKGDSPNNNFNTTINGIAEGNYYSVDGNPVYDGLEDSNRDGWADGGKSYPYSETTMPYWLGPGEDYGPAVPVVSYVYGMQAYLDGVPELYFTNNSIANITTNYAFTETPVIDILNPAGTEVVATNMDFDGSAYYYGYNTTADSSVGWYNVTITSSDGNPFSRPYLFYVGRTWQNNYTDYSGSTFPVRAELNVTEPDATYRASQPLDIRVNTTVGANETSLRLVLNRNGTLLEIPSQFYNFTYLNTTGRVSAANMVFVDAFLQNQTKNYYYYYSFGSKPNTSYSTDLNSTNGTLSIFQNTNYLIGMDYAHGGTITNITSKYSNFELRGGDLPMFFPEVYQASSSTFSHAYDESSPTTSFTRGALFSKYSAYGNPALFTYNLTYIFYPQVPYFIVETRVTPDTPGSAIWDTYSSAYLRVHKSRFDYLSYHNATDIYNLKLSTTEEGDSLSGLSPDWLSFTQGDMHNGLAWIPISNTSTKSYARTVDTADPVDYHSFSELSYSGAISSSDYFYSKDAYLLFDPANTSTVNDTWLALTHPMNYSLGISSPLSVPAPNYSISNYTPQSPNDTSDITCFSLWESQISLDYYTIRFQSRNYSINATSLLGSTSSWVNYTANSSLLQTGAASCNITVYDVLGQSNSTFMSFNISDTKPPLFSRINTTPSSERDLDPNVTITVGANLTEFTDVDKVFLFYNSTSNATPIETNMSRISNGSTWFYYAANFTPEEEGNYTYWIYANDTVGNQNTSRNYNLSIFYDWTWTLSPATFNAHAAPGENASLMNLTITATGDKSISVQVRSNYDGLVYYNGTEEAEITAYDIENGTNLTIPIEATAKLISGITSITFTLTAQNASAMPQSNTSTGDLISSNQSIFIYAVFSSPPTSVVQGQTGVNISARVFNYGTNQTATGTRLIWALPSDWSVSSLLLNMSIGNLTPGASSSIKTLTSISIPSSAQTGNRNVSIYAYCNENSTYNASTMVNVVSNQPTPPVPPTPSGGGGGGGGGTPSNQTWNASKVNKTVEKRLTVEQRSQFFNTLVSYELVRGKDQQFELILTNPLDYPLENVTINVSGYLEQYIRLEPTEIASIPAHSNQTIKIFIEAPKYFTEGSFTLYFDIAGTYTYTTEDAIITTKVRERRTVDLMILEMSRPDAKKLIDEAYSIKQQLQDAGAYQGAVTGDFDDAVISFGNDRFADLQLDVEKMREIRRDAFVAKGRLDSLKDKLDRAQAEDFKLAQSMRLYTLAASAYERGDYVNAMLRVGEAELTFELETRQEFSLTAFLNRYAMHIISGTLLFIFVTGIIFVDVRFWMIDNEISQLSKEEEIVLNLIRESQTDYFEKSKLSTAEYTSSVEQYDARLSNMIHRKVQLETVKKDYFNFSGKSARMRAEKSRLEEMMRILQKGYLEEGKMETRAYENRMKSYVARLSEVEEEIAVQEAQDRLKRGKFLGIDFSSLVGKKTPPLAPPMNAA